MSATRGSSGPVRVLPLGGLGEIGKNMTVVEQDGRIVIVDVGLRFPSEDMVGIDLVLPDFAYLRSRVDDIEAILVTHGHEDHLGALPWILRELKTEDIPVYGGPLTMAMARSKLDEHRLREVRCEDVDPGEVLDLGPFTAEFLHLTHSIPDANGIALGTDQGTIVITGDYKFDQTPVAGGPADFGRLSRLGDEGVLLLCGDSTNVDRPGWSTSESVVGPHLDGLIGQAKGRVIVTCFASNLHRVQQVVRAAVAHDRKVCLVGRSMRKNTNIGKSLGHIAIPAGTQIQPRDLDSFADERVVVISTGSQGEPLSALRRMASKDHRDVQLREGDTVIFSATPIPGNERAVNGVIDHLSQLGCRVLTPRDAPIHASGHGYQEELKLMINLLKPRYVMPFHGDYKRLQLHGELAESLGVPADHVFRGRNGLPLEVSDTRARWGDPVQAGVIYVDGTELGDESDAALRDRRTISADGILVVVATISEQTGRSVADPEVILRGVPTPGDAAKLIDDVRDAVDGVLDGIAGGEGRDNDVLQGLIHDELAELVWSRLRRRPLVLPIVVQV